MRKTELIALMQAITSFRDHVDQRFDAVNARLDQVIADVAFLKVETHHHGDES